MGCYTMICCGVWSEAGEMQYNLLEYNMTVVWSWYTKRVFRLGGPSWLPNHVASSGID